MAPSTFASAAAGSNQNSSTARQEGGSEWPRRTNGATQTFRRPSLATSHSQSNSIHQRDTSLESQPARYVPPHRNGTVSDSRYPKEQLIDLFKTQNNTDNMSRDSLTSLFVAGWEPEQLNGFSDGSSGWAVRDAHRDGQAGPEAFWSNEGSMLPLGLVEMTEEEKEAFSTSVNSPIKPMNTATREGQGREGMPLRKISISQNPNSPGFAMNSPSATRTGRRREASESYPFPTNPLASPKPRDENRTTSPPPALRRRTTGFKDPDQDQKATEPEAMGGGGSGDASKQPGLAQPRIAANPLSAGLGGPASPWGTVQPSPGFAPMGSFGSFASGTPTAAPGEKRPGFGSGRAESRFKGLMSKDSHDDIGKTLKEKSSLSNFGKPADNSSWRTGWGEQGRSSMEQEHEGPSGSAALGGGEEISPPPIRGLHDLGTPHRPDHREEFGFSAWTPETGIKGFSHDQQHDQQSRGPQHVHQAMSPTNTNPYQSPQQGHAEANDLDTDDSELQNLNIPGLGGLMNDELGPMPGHFGGFSSFSQAPGDRSATSSAGPNRAFPGLSGLGALPGLSGSAAWGGLPATSATPTRAHGGFGDSMFGSAADLQSPSLAGLGPSSFFGSSQSAAPGAGRGMSRMGSLFQQSGPTGMGAGDASRTVQEDEESVPAAPGLNDDTSARGFPQQSESRQSLDIPSGASQTSLSQQQPIGSSNNNQPPTAQQKTMVMPDRMRWIYRDPSGNTQGPWTGLEMHDWYKAGFFSPELLVKKAEDPDYEPLAQLIRRIGNSREPFLVPQIGIPHGTPQSNWGATGPLTGPTTTGQPPFAASFPSFGTTLTAEQQNALERRKQEEQYLMARQKEHLAQQQMAQRLQISGQHGLLPHQLQHHPSAQSLHSQPSFGSIASGPGFQASPMHAPTPGQAASGGFDSQFGAQNRGFGAVGAGASASAGLGALREEELPSAMNELGINQHQRETSGAPGQPFPQQSQQQQQGQYEQDIHEQQAKLHEQQVKLILEDNIRLQRGQDAAQQAHHEQHFTGERLDEFQKLQQQHQFDDQQAQQHYQQGQDEARERLEQAQQEAYAQAQRTPVREPKSLTEQVQQAVSAKQSPAQASPWGKVDPALPQPFPPAPSQSPLPAPAAQRNRSHVADALHAESHSRSQSPSVDTPSASIAPWAKEPAEAPRGPSLKEIQEAEAKNAAKAEALAADARRQALEREALAQMQAAAAASTSAGLPSSATWATAGGASPSAASTASAWAKAAKPVAGPTSAKSMAQIQKEEEARKKRLVAAAAQAQQNAALAGAAAQVQGKRYAELAGKVASGAPASPVAPQGSSAWTTVGAGGKTKAPLSPATAPPVRSASTTTTPLAAPALKKPTMPRTTTASNTAAVNAQEEFKRWAAGELRGDLKPGTTAEEFVTNLLAFPPEADIITEAVHSVSNTIDSRHFAEEFMRRRKMADKGIFDASSLAKSASPANGDAGRNGGGWSEVAKKGGKEAATPKENDLAGNFKVVAAKKKTKR